MYIENKIYYISFNTPIPIFNIVLCPTMETLPIGINDILTKKVKCLTGKHLLRLEDYDTLKDIIKQICPNKDAKILMLGCGNAGITFIRNKRIHVRRWI